MTTELHSLATDPKYAIQFAIGDPSPVFPTHTAGTGIQFCGVFFPDTKRYVMKKAHFSADDVRVFDFDTGLLTLVSHHPGKNPYGALDPLSLTAADDHFAVGGGEWASVCNVSSNDARFHSFKIRPKALSRHGRQLVKRLDDDVVLNVAKMGRLKSRSLRAHFVCGTGSDTDAVYKCVADYTGRTVQIMDADQKLVAQIAKTTKALIKSAAFGGGSESTIDIAPGVDCSTILALVYGMKQIGAHFMNDAFGNFVVDPTREAAVDSVLDGSAMEKAEGAIGGVADGVDESGLEGVGEMLEGASEEGGGVGEAVSGVGRMLFDTFFGEEE